MQGALCAKNSDLKKILLGCVLVCVGLYGIVNVFLYGQEHSYGVSREIPLGILLIGYAFFVGISIGVSLIATFSHVFGFEAFHYRSKHIVLLSFSTLVAAFYLIFWELGGPFELQVLRFIRYYFNFEISSPIWWMATFYLIETPLLLIELFLLLKGSKKATFYAGIVGFIIGVLAFSTLSMVFAVNAAKPLWHTPSFTISFVLGALICGSSVVMLLMSITCKKVDERVVKALSKTLFFSLIVASFIYLYTVIINSYSSGYLAENFKILTNGAMSFNYYFFEILIGIIVPFILVILAKFKNLKILSIASLCAIMGAFFARYDAVIGGQIIKVESEFLPTLEFGSYTPSISEISIFISAFGVCMLVYTFIKKWLKLDEE